jgi:hypothetical protein
VLVYDVMLMVGAIGLVAMVLLGFAHGGHGHAEHGHGGHAALDHGHAGHGHMGHGALDHGHAGHGHGGHTGAHAHGHGGDAHAGHGGHAAHAGEHCGDVRAIEWLGLLSPLTLFSMCLGAGATGILLRSLGVHSALLVALAALAGAILFRAGVVGPIWNLIFSFVSRPARALEGALLQLAEAVTPFNAKGEGLVRLEVDGQCVDVLARLEHPDQGSRVLRGQQVRVESVDPHTNTVTVSRP